MYYSIGEFSKLTNLGVHTLRYYEKEKLIAPLRDSGNRRLYSDMDAAWVDFIKRLKETGMPIKEIRQYAKLRAAGGVTMKERLEMLTLHRRSLSGQIAALLEHQAALDKKIEFYQKEIDQMGKALE